MPPADGETPSLVELVSMTHAEEVHAHVFGPSPFDDDDDDDDDDDSTTGSLPQLVPEADTLPGSDASTLEDSDSDGWMPRPTDEGEDLEGTVLQDAPAMLLPAELALADDGEDSEGSTFESSAMPALVPADSSDDDFLFDHSPPEPPARVDEECVLGMACASCGTPVVAASELLPEQTNRLERKVYAYELDFLDEENAWCYSATNESDDRYDVARFGGDARFRVTPPSLPPHPLPPHPPPLAGCACCSALQRLTATPASLPPLSLPPRARRRFQFCVRGKPTDAISFFPPYGWSPASCPRCSTLLGWRATRV